MSGAQGERVRSGDLALLPGIGGHRLLTRLAHLIPTLSLIAGLAITGMFWMSWQRQQTTIVREDFRLQVTKVRSGIENRIRANEQILRGISGLFAVRGDVDRAQFRTYVDSLQLHDSYPGIQGIGFARLIRPDERERFVQSVRAEGFPAFQLRPSGKRDIYSAILYLEPFDWRNQRAFGFDMYSESVRREAMDRAWASGKPAASGKVRLVQETEKDVQAGFLVYLPVYRAGQPPATSAARRKALLGWAYSPLRTKDLIENFLQRNYPEVLDRMALFIYDGTQPSSDGLMFASTRSRTTSPHTLQDESRIRLSGHEWTLIAQTLPAFDQQARQLGVKDWIILGGGGALSLAMSSIAWLLIRTHFRVRSALRQTAAAHRQLTESQQRLQLIFDTSDIAIFMTDLKGNLTHANARMAEMFRCPLGKLVGSHYVAHVHPSERSAAQQRMLEVFRREIADVRQERRYWRDDGTEFWGHLGGRLIRDADGHSVGMVGVIADVSQRKEAEERITFLAHHDYLTGLPNRALFVERVGQALTLAKRYQRRLGLLFLDLDGFKAVNDDHGHQAGDLVLREVARRLKTHIRASDTACRQGGDEFVILVPELPDLEHLQTLAELLEEVIRRPYQSPSETLTVGVSIGAAVYPDDGKSVNELMQSADAAMYRTKQTSRKGSARLVAVIGKG